MRTRSRWSLDFARKVTILTISALGCALEAYVMIYPSVAEKVKVRRPSEAVD